MHNERLNPIDSSFVVSDWLGNRVFQNYPTIKERRSHDSHANNLLAMAVIYNKKQHNQNGNSVVFPILARYSRL